MNQNRNKYAALYFSTFTPLGALCPLIGTYLAYIGFSGTQIGITTALGTTVSILAGFFWGKTYSNSTHKRRVIIILCIMASILAVTGSFVRAFGLYVAFYCAMYFFQGPINGLTDTMIINNGGNFSKTRSFGALGYAIAVLVAGQLAECAGLELIFYIYALGFISAAIIISTIKDKPMPQVEEIQSPKEKIQISQVFQNKRLVKLLICAFFLLGTNVPNSTYFAFLFQDGNGSVGGVGVAFLLMAGSEAPFMFLTPKLCKKISPEKLIAVAAIVAVVRFAIYTTGPSYVVLLATFFLQGIVNGILLVEMVKYVSRVAGERLSGMAISTYYSVSNNGSTIVISFISGKILDVWGSTGVYAFFTIISLIGVILYFSMGFHKSQNN